MVDQEAVEAVKKARNVDLEVVKQLSKAEQFQFARVRDDFDVEDIE